MRILVLFVGILLLLVQCVDTIAPLPDDPFFTDDGNSDGIPDSIAKYAPGCTFSLNQCGKTAQENRKNLIAEQIKLDSNKIQASLSDTVVYTREIIITLKSNQGKGKIYYSFSDSIPSDTSAKSYLYTDSLNLTYTLPLFVVALDSGKRVSPVEKFNFKVKIDEPLVTPVYLPSGGHYTDTVHVTLFHPKSKVSIHYTLDGTLPSQSSPVYTKPLVLQSATVLKTRAYYENSVYMPSEFTSEDYYFDVAPLKFTDTSKYYTTQPLWVSLKTATPEAKIYANLKTADLDTNEKFLVKEGIFVTDTSSVVRVRAHRPGFNPSVLQVLSYKFDLADKTIKPITNQPSGIKNNTFSLKLVFQGDSNVKTFYTTDTSKLPDTLSQRIKPLVDSIKIDSSQSFIFRSFSSSKKPSELVTVNYILKCDSVLIDFSEENADSGKSLVTLSTGTVGASIFYTTDGSVPDTQTNKSSTQIYKESFHVSSKVTVKALAIRPRFLSSGLSSRTYVFDPNVPCAQPEFLDSSLAGTTIQRIALKAKCPVIKYTNDFTDPASSATAQIYKEPIILKTNTTLRALATGDSFKLPSALNTQSFRVKLANPVIVQADGSPLDTSTLFTQGKGPKFTFRHPDSLVTLRCAFGTQVTTSSPECTSYTLDSTTFWSVRAFGTNNEPSDIQSGVLRLKIAKPISNLASGIIERPTWLAYIHKDPSTLLYSLTSSVSLSSPEYKDSILIFPADLSKSSSLFVTAQKFLKPKYEPSDTLSLDFTYQPKGQIFLPPLVLSLNNPRKLATSEGYLGNYQLKFISSDSIVKHNKGILIPRKVGIDTGFYVSEDGSKWGFLTVLVRDGNVNPLPVAPQQTWEINLRTQISGNEIKENQPGFSIPVQIPSLSAAPSAKSLVFASPTGKIYPSIFEGYYSETKTAQYWVLLDTLFSNNNYGLLMAYRYADPISQNPSEELVFDSSRGYWASYHFGYLGTHDFNRIYDFSPRKIHLSYTPEAMGVELSKPNFLGQSIKLEGTGVFSFWDKYGKNIKQSRDLQKGISASLWFKLKANSSDLMSLFVSGSADNTASLGCFASLSTVQCVSAGRMVEKTIDLDTSWHHLTVIANSNGLTMTLDDQHTLVNSATVKGIPIEETFNLGGLLRTNALLGAFIGNDHSFSGQMDALMILDKTLSPQWGSACYRTQKPGQKIISAVEIVK